MPRASQVAIYDRLSTPLWSSDGQGGADLLRLVEESLNSVRYGSSGSDQESRHGFSRSWDGDTAYIFLLREGATLLGALAVSCQDGSGGARSFAFVRGLLCPVLQVLVRELAHEYNLGDLQKNLTTRDGDLDLLLDASGAEQDDTGNDLEQLLKTCVTHLDCSLGALAVPDRKIALSHSADGSHRDSDAEQLEKTQKHLLAWVQVQRRTLVLNKTPPNSPLGTLPYKILACPIRHGVQHVTGVLLLFKRVASGDFTARQVRIIEILARRVAHTVQGVYESATGLLTRSAFEQRALAVLAESQQPGEHCVAYADVDRLHVVNENHGMHIGDKVIASIAETLRSNIAANVSASRISGDRFALFFANANVEHAAAFADTLCNTISQIRLRHDDRDIELSLSIGLAEVPNTRYPLSQALAAAEIACKAAKDIIGDDGSGPETRAIVRKWQERLAAPLEHVWQPDEGFRLARARNIAIAACSGDYVVMLDGDMVPHPRFIEDHKRAARPGAFAQGVRALTDAAGAARMLQRQQPFLSFFESGVSRRRHLVRLPLLSKCLRWRRNTFNCIRGANQAYWREHLLAVNGFDERMVGWGYDDCEIAARLYHTGIDRFDLRFGGLAVHLWHPRREPLEGDPTQAIFLSTLAKRTTRCFHGIDRHSTSRAAP